VWGDPQLFRTFVIKKFNAVGGDSDLYIQIKDIGAGLTNSAATVTLLADAIHRAKQTRVAVDAKTLHSRNHDHTLIWYV
jgi:diaminopimelate epimerase